MDDVHVPQIDADQLPTEFDATTVLLDVREDDEVAIVKIDGARHIPLHELPQRWEELPRNGQLLVYCHHGMRSLRATEFLRARGLGDTHSIIGGIDAWARIIDPSLLRY